MIISMSNPIIAYSEKGTDFKYERLFLQVMKPYILEFKNAEYDKLTDKDKSVALARIIKSMSVNGVPVTDFFKEQIAEWSDKENFEKNRLVILMIAKEIFGCYDRNCMNSDGDFYKSPYLFSISNSIGNDEYFEPEKSGGFKNKFGKLFGKKDSTDDYYSYFLFMRKQLAEGKLTKTPVFVEAF